jgi:hypothetical protein
MQVCPQRQTVGIGPAATSQSAAYWKSFLWPQPNARELTRAGQTALLDTNCRIQQAGRLKLVRRGGDFVLLRDTSDNLEVDVLEEVSVAGELRVKTSREDVCERAELG